MKTKLRITALSNNCHKYAVIFMGEKVAVAFSRDSGAKVGHGARMVSGEIDSGGSRANWHCRVNKGSVFELEVDEELFNRNKNRIKKWKMEVIDDYSITETRSIILHEGSQNLE